MKVTKAQVVRRGLAHLCPNCGERALFPSGSFRVHRRCPNCRTGFDRGAGFFLGPLVLNYTMAVFGFALPAIAAGAMSAISWPTALTIAATGCTVMPVLLYRSAWSWWLMLYFLFLPESLPANGGRVGDSEED